MKRLFSWIALPVLVAGMTLSAQNPQPGQGRGRGNGHPYCDANKDGICDHTGKPVGECRQNVTAQRRGPWRGRAVAQRADCGVGRGLAPCGARQATPPAKK
ncbi:MAG: hypothetical protein HY820_35975 [Acidobacteria bacterium]|nr:hypothetical protein [Acidobacteriota bacterium]